MTKSGINQMVADRITHGLLDDYTGNPVLAMKIAQRFSAWTMEYEKGYFYAHVADGKLEKGGYERIGKAGADDFSTALVLAALRVLPGNVQLGGVEIPVVMGQ